MDRADARAGEHGDYRLRGVGHVDDDTIAFRNTAGSHGAAQPGRRIFQFGKGEAARYLRYSTFILDSDLIAKAIVNMPVDAIMAGVEFAANEPARDRSLAIAQHLVPALGPCQFVRYFCPESVRLISGEGA